MDKNNGKQNNDFRELSEAEIENSSIFSKPQIEDVTPPKTKNIVARTFIAIAVVVALIASVLLINKFFGRSDLSSSSSDTSNVSSEVQEGISVVGINSNDITSIHLENSKGTIDFYPIKDKTDRDDDGVIDNDWYIKGIDKKYIDSESTLLTADDCAKVECLFKREIDASFDYGFDKPEAVVEVKHKGGKYTVTIGKKFNNGGIEGAYVKVSTKPQSVYIMSSQNIEYFSYDVAYYISSYANTKVEENDGNAEYFSSELDTFDYIKMSGEIVKVGDAQFEPYGRENSNLLYKMTKPTYTHVSGEKISEILNIMKDNLECSEVLYFGKDGIEQDTLEEYGLDKPKAVVEYKVGTTVVKLKFSENKDNSVYYNMQIEGEPAVYKVTKKSFVAFGYRRIDFANDWVFLDNIDGLKALTFNIDNKAYTFNIKSKETDDGTKLTVKYDGKTIKEDNFKNYYSYLTAIAPYLSETSLIEQRPDNCEQYFSVIVTTTDKIGDPDLNLTIYKLSDNDTRYYIELDGNPIGLCKKDYADMIVDNIQKLISNKEIEEIL